MLFSSKINVQLLPGIIFRPWILVLNLFPAKVKIVYVDFSKGH